MGLGLKKAEKIYAASALLMRPAGGVGLTEVRINSAPQRRHA